MAPCIESLIALDRLMHLKEQVHKVHHWFFCNHIMLFICIASCTDCMG